MVLRLLVLFGLTFSFGLYAENIESLTAVGTARIEWDEPQAREAATKDAYKDAIRKTLIVMSW